MQISKKVIILIMTWTLPKVSFLYFYFIYIFFIIFIIIIQRFHFARSPMCWEKKADLLIIAGSSLMSRNRFDKLMQKLHLAENFTLDSNGKSSKVRPSIEKVNKQCLLQHLAEQTVSSDESMVSLLEILCVSNLLARRQSSFDIGIC